ncbi:MAG: ComF family protein [Candidatus Staskawiczbacteria bacterium]|nr:ComF family protein [Candidatus Staskawiczbacteria bacterium]
MKKSKEFLLELFFPSFCLGCKKEGTFLCYDCKSTLEISEYNYCLCNKDPLRLPAEEKNGKCGRCRNKKLSGLYSALPYKEKFLTRKLIYQFKYQPYIKSLSKPLAEILIEHFVLAKNNTEDIWENSILIPVPLEIKRLKNRGYNQSEAVGKELGHMLNVPLTAGNLVKIKKTLPQMELSAKDRQENLKDAFAIKNPQEITNKKIFLVDDVYTTGATMEECAKTLKEAGAKQVWGIVIAREG